MIERRSKKLNNLREKYNSTVMERDRQKAGYDLEDIIKDLFALFEIEYTKSYKTETQQIDGHFKLDGFDYLVEAKWRKKMPTDQEIGGFKQKVDSKLESTRGIYISIAGFRTEVVKSFCIPGANIILMDGEHLIHILEGRIDLKDGLRYIVERAAQRGNVYSKFFK